MSFKTQFTRIENGHNDDKTRSGNYRAINIIIALVKNEIT